MKLTGKQQRFVDEYIKNPNATRAAINAGYSEKTARNVAAENLTKPHIKDAIVKANAKKIEESKIDANFVLTNAALLLEKCLGLKPIDKVVISEGMAIEQQVREFNAAGAGKALDLIGKHIDVGAFLEKKAVEHSGSIEVMTPEQRLARINELKARLGK
jgi:phage terminase small subunit